MSFGALAFLNPWLLAALVSLPLIYWLLRTVPPRPKQVEFPATRILVGLENREKTPAKTPWWLLLIRLLAAALVIFALAEPVLNPSRETSLKGSGPVAIVVDNGWASGSQWARTASLVDRLITDAEAQRRPVVVVETASATKGRTARIEAPADGRNTAALMQPQPYDPDRKAALSVVSGALQDAKETPSIVWLTDGIDHRSASREFADGLAALAKDGTFAVVARGASAEAIGVSAEVTSNGQLGARILRAGGGMREGTLAAFSAKGERLGDAPFKLAPGSTAADVVFDLPLELRNQVTRVEISGESSAGAVSLLDRRSQWQRVGLISGESQEQAQPLLAPLYYINKAIQPFAEVVRPKDSNLAAGIDTVLKSNASVLVLADIGTLTGEIGELVADWVKKGGVLVRFAGPRLEKGGDDLLPVALRLGGRTLGGALSWSTPQPLAPFEEQSLFAGLSIPPDVTVQRQVLADPARLTPDVKVWARLKDGTPLVTAARKGEGTVVLFHVTGNSDWSSLPLSGLFVDMLKRITMLGAAGGAGSEAALAESKDDTEVTQQSPGQLAPLQTLDGFGMLKAPPATAQALDVAKLASITPGIDHPPGYYGPAGNPRALNVLRADSQVAPLSALPGKAEMRSYDAESTTPVKPWLLAAALALLFADIVAVLLMQLGGMRMRRRASGAAVGAAVLAILAAWPGDVHAQQAPPALEQPIVNDNVALQATSKVTLGFVLTGDAETDDVSRLGLSGLGRVLASRTAVEPGDPMGVDIATDEIAFYPVLYWPVLDSAKPLPTPVLAKIDAFMKQGGMIIFDTRDFGGGAPTSMGIGGQRSAALQRLVGSLDLPRLEPVPEGHVLTKSFYLLRSFPGRYSGGELWVEAAGQTDAESQGRKARRADGVSSIMITSNDFAAAWALDERGRPLYPTLGGENQREMALRTGVNIVMHALTGNYKADQVHVPALLERLGQ